MIEVSSDTVQEYIRLLVECGDVYEIQEDYTIRNKHTGTRVTIPVGRTEKPVLIFHRGATSEEDGEWLNPFAEVVGHVPVRDWFFKALSGIAACLTKYIVRKLVEDTVSAKDDNTAAYDLMSKIRDKVDEKTLDELDKIPGSAWLTIHYNKSKKHAEAQTSLFDEALRNEYYKSIRKKTWAAIETVFVVLFGSKDLEDYRYNSKTLSIPETEGKLSIFVALIQALDGYAQEFLHVDLHSKLLKEHLEHLEEYAKLYTWLTVNCLPESTPPPQTGYQPIVNCVGSPSGYQPSGYQPNGYAPGYGAPVSSGPTMSISQASAMNRPIGYQQSRPNIRFL